MYNLYATSTANISHFVSLFWCPLDVKTPRDVVPVLEREFFIDNLQPTGPSPLYHRDDLVDRPRAMGVGIPFSG